MNGIPEVSDPAARDLSAGRTPAPPGGSVAFGRSVAAVIGIDEYGAGIPRLSTPVADATRLAQILGQEHGYDVRLVAGDASLARLRTLFCTELPEAIGPDDRLLVYFAGHGVALDGDDGPAGFLVPQGARPGDPATFLPMTGLHAWLTALPCRHMLAVLDCCFAGAFRWAALRAIDMPPAVVHRERYERYLKSPAWQVLTSAAYDQRALDVLTGQVLGVRGPEATGDAPARHSPFAAALFDALAGEGDLIPRGRGDGIITATELYLYLRERVELEAATANRHEQTPGLWALNKHRKGEFVFLVPGKSVDLPPAPPATPENNPYRGLRSYETQDAELFFGRTDEIAALAEAVAQKPFVAVVGASGTGKSSLVKAGLLPRLAATAPGGAPAAWRVLAPMRPAQHPLQALAALLGGEDAAVPLRTDRTTGLSDWIAAWRAAHPGARLLLTVDQLEELVTLCRDEAERDLFLANLVAALAAHAGVFHAIVTVRLDFEQQFAAQAGPLAGLWPGGRYVINPLGIDDFRQIIEGPAALRVLYFDPAEMVDELIKDVIQTPGGLPLLSFSLSELYVKYVDSGRDDRSLRLDDYRALGGVVGALRNRANQEYEALPDEAHRETMRRVMLRMVATEGGELARRRAPMSELMYPTTAEQRRVDTVLERLVEARLLVRGSEPAASGAPDPYVEPAHDALILSWDRLLLWRKDADEYLPLQRRLAQAAAEWWQAPTGERPGLLWNDNPRLPQAEAVLWPDRPRQGLAGARAGLRAAGAIPADTRWLNRDEVAFVAASVDERARLYRRIVSIAAAVMLVLSAITAFALVQRNNANVQAGIAAGNEAKAIAEANARETEVVVRRTAEANAVAETHARETEVVVRRTAEANAVNAAATAVAENKVARARALALNAIQLVDQDAELARLLAIESAQLARTSEGELALRDALTNRSVSVFRGHTLPVLSISLSPDNRLALTGSADGTCRLWEVATGVEVEAWRATGTAYCAGAITPDGRYALVSTEQTQLLDFHSLRVLSSVDVELAVGLDPLRVDAGGGRFWADGKLWEIPSGRMLIALPPGSAKARVFNPDLSLAATQGLNNSLVVQSLPDGQEVAAWSLADGENPLGFSLGSGELLTYAADKRSVSVRRTRDGTEVQRFDNVVNAYMNSDGARVALADAGNAVTVYRAGPKGYERKVSWTAPAPQLSRLEFAADYVVLIPSGGPNLATTLSVWDTGGDDQDTPQDPLLGSLAGNGSWVNAVAVSRDGTLVASAGDDQTAHVWSLAADLPSAVFPGTNGAAPPFRNVFTSDGRWLVTVKENRAHLWDMTTRKEARVLASEGITFTAASLTPDGARMVTWVNSTDNPAGAALWDVATGKVAARLAGQVSGAYLSPDGRYVATREGAVQITVWDVETGERLWSAATGDAWAGRAVWSDDAGLFGVESNQGIRLYRAATGEVLQSLPTVGQDFAISPDNQRVATTGGPQVWDVRTGAKLFDLRGQSERVNAVAFSPDGTQLAMSNYDGAIVLWDARTGRPEARLLNHVNAVHSVVYSPNGRFLVSASDDGTARIWDTAAGQLVMTLHTRAPLNMAAFSPDGAHVITGGPPDGTPVFECQACQDFDGLLAGVRKLVHRELTAQERATYVGE